MSRNILLLGGNGKVARHLTPILLSKSWAVTSVVRAQEQVSSIEALAKTAAATGPQGKGTLKVLVRSLQDVSDVSRAQAILDEVKPDTVVFSAGAGGKGPPESTFQVDRDAATSFIRASASTPSITKFILVSYIADRRRNAPWWDEASWADAVAVNQALANYHKAKIVADEVLYEEGLKRGSDFAAVSLRPGTLSEEPAGKVELGKTKASKGQISREAVAKVAAELIAKEGLKTSWIDLLDGEEDIGAAVDRVVREGVDAIEGEEFWEKIKGQGA